MPGILYQPVNRREFLRRSSRALAAAALASELNAFAADATRKPLRYALLSDTHIAADPKDTYRGFLPTENLKTIVPRVIAVRPEGVIINGDAARLSGELADYETLKNGLAQLAAETPVYLDLGNHDNRDNFYKVFDPPAGARQSVPNKYVLVLDRPEVRMILLDSLFYVNKTEGFLGKAQRDWLARHLESPDARPVVIFVHHTLGEGDGELLDAERLFRLVRPHRKVKAIFYGHSHRYSFGQDEGIHLINLPAVGYNFNDSEPVGWMDAVFSARGVELTLNAFAGNRAKDGEKTALEWRA